MPKRQNTERLRTFLRMLDPNMPTADVRTALKKAGITAAPSTLYNVRLELRKEAAKEAAKQAQEPAPVSAKVAPGSSEMSPEQAFLKLVARIGTDRAYQLLQTAISREIA